MLTLGDVLATIATIVFFGLASLCAMPLSIVIFPTKTEAVAKRLEEHPWKSGVWGIFAGTPLIVLGIILFQIPIPLVRAMGLLLFLAIFLIAIAGMGGFALLVGQRLASSRNPVSEANLRPTLSQIFLAATLLVGAAMFPIVGWFLLVPLLFLCSLGAGISTIKSKRKIVLVTSQEA